MTWIKRRTWSFELKLHNLFSTLESLEEAFSNALNSVLGGAGSGVSPRARFHSKFQREVEEHDQDLEKKYDEDLNTTLIFVSTTLFVSLR